MAHTDKFLLAGVMGWPVMHSRSPMIHNHWFKRHALAGAYVPLAIQPQGLSAALRALPALGFAGCNVTLPHKQAAMSIVDEVHDSARRIGAISCVVVRPDGSLSGSNNDAYGFIRNLRQQQPQWRADAGPVVVIGAGGGSRAVCYGLLQEGVREIRLVNRRAERAREVAQAFGAAVSAHAWEQRHEVLDGAALVVNTTSQGMVGQGALDLSLDRLPTSAIAADIVYIPLQTQFLAAARARQRHGQRPGHAAAPRPLGLEGLVRPGARSERRVALVGRAKFAGRYRLTPCSASPAPRQLARFQRARPGPRRQTRRRGPQPRQPYCSVEPPAQSLCHSRPTAAW